MTAPNSPSPAPGLERFIAAQADTYARALEEIGRGRKTSHWMWFIFPQLEGLGRSERSRFYGIKNLDEARAYWQHPVLGSRLRACIQALRQHRDKSALAMLGEVDAMKLHSCLTLFSAAADDPADRKLAELALAQFYHGAAEPMTVALQASQNHTKSAS